VRGGKEEEEREEAGNPNGWLTSQFTPHVRSLEKYPDCRTDLIGGAATQTFGPGGAANTPPPPLESEK